LAPEEKTMERRAFVLLPAAAGLAAAADDGAEAQVRAAMEAWRQARIHHDRSALEKLYAPELVYVHSTGKRELRPEAIDTVANGKERVETCEFAGMNVQVYGDTAVAWTNLTLRTVSEGTTTTLILGTLLVWVKKPQGWQLVARQAVRLNP
jgi:ketosteroid isomerase-like protein